MTDIDPVRTPGFVCKRFGVAGSTVRYWIDVELIHVHARTPGGHARFLNSEVERLWRENEGKILGSKSVMTSGTLTGTTPSQSAPNGRPWTPATTPPRAPGSPSSSSEAPTTEMPAETFLA